MHKKYKFPRFSIQNSHDFQSTLFQRHFLYNKWRSDTDILRRLFEEKTKIVDG